MMNHLGTFAPVAFASALTHSASGRKTGKTSADRASEPPSEPRPLDLDFGVCIVCFAPRVECMKRAAEAQLRA